MQYQYIKLVVVISISILSNNLSTQNSKTNPDLAAAFQAQGSLNLIESRALFNKVAYKNNNSDEDRCKALRQLAIQDSKFFKDFDKAIGRLRLADSLGHHKSETYIVKSRVEKEAFKYNEAIKSAKKSILLSESKADKRYAEYKYCSIILAQAIQKINNNDTIDIKLLNESSVILHSILNKNPTYVNAADILLGTSLLLSDGKGALRGWLAYFRISSANNAYKYIREPAKKLSEILSIWGNRSLNQKEKESLIVSLAESRFYNYAKVLALINDKNTFGKPVQNIIEYAIFLEDIKELTNNYYRNTTISNNVSNEYLDNLTSRCETLYNKVFAKKINDTFSFANFRNLINTEFGGMLMVASTSSSAKTGLIFGHIVNERIRPVEQYGHKADFNFTELDMMISNGYPSWFWENRGAGGFAMPNGFLRIKRMFKHLGISAWNTVTDSIKRWRIEKNINENLINSTKTTNINLIYSALSKKLELDALEDLYNALLDKGYSGLDLQLKFIEKYDLLRDNATMFAHEGRHSLDRIVLGDAYRDLGSKMIEFRGRLSQIAYSESPKLEVADLINSIGATNNGQANQMISEVLEKCIKNESNKIKGFDSTKQAISQLYKLTNKQIITCIRNADPFYRASLKQQH